jgi:hypothetical protein
MEKGFNSDVAWRGVGYHVQTEDWGQQNPFLVTRVFRDGAVVKSIKTSYQEIFPRSPVADTKAIKLAMKIQHQQILDLLLSGHLL